ncbi:6-phosphogluconate dehydrogenase (decarboxylating) [Candidatus Woesearchaeota archaeon CG10_big_fil_rev_8_21_14_0_10_37_12]|nr:MAG: 6-phosphogluconate dehydrogenase (decarboxylating) [Candidatus Woesearchaeota archaeon CG10_big_fil_rev_8_21_14_0_10_37_12]
MNMGFIGLGRMGSNMVLNLLEHKHRIIGFNRSPEPTRKLAKKGLIPAYSFEELMSKLPKRKIIWLMISAGKPVDDTLKKLVSLLNKDDVVIDGGNSYFKDSMQRYKNLKKKGIHYLDCGTSGGIEGARYGACMMIGGNKKVFKTVEKLFKDMCVKNGYGYMGTSGAGHFVKMVHNGIEYGMMGAINEGFLAVEKHAPTFGTDLKQVCKVYAHGSIVESRLMSWLWDAFQRKDYLEQIACQVPKGETEKEMQKLEKLAEMKVLHEARMMRQRSRKKKGCAQLIATMRNEFGGHAVKKK